MGKQWDKVYSGNLSETIRISQRVYLRKGNLPVRDQCNTGIIHGKTGLILVDLPEQCPKEEILEEAELFWGKPVTHLLFTHAHGDHRKGLASLKRRNLTLVSSFAAQKEIQVCYPDLSVQNWMTPENGEELELDGVRFQFWIPQKLPAHSPWDMSICLQEEAIVFTGDFVVPPFYMYNYSGNEKNWCDALKHFRESYETKLLLMGHGDPAEGKDILPELIQYLTCLGELYESVQYLAEKTDRDTVLRQLREIGESKGMCD